MKPLIVANWKMNPQTESEALDLFGATLAAAKSAKHATVIVAPPFPFLSPIEKRWSIRDAELRGDAPIHLAAQDLFWEREGAFTGEVSSGMEKELGVTYALVGHSERRIVLGETDEMVHKKMRRSFESGLKPILCVGERERHGDGLPQAIEDQLRSAVRDIPALFLESLLVAYEPVWAIGSATPDTSQDAHKIALYIRRILTEMYGEGCGQRAQILYGGSVTPANAVGFISQTEGEISGLLVGGASLHADDIVRIIEEADGLPQH